MSDKIATKKSGSLSSFSKGGGPKAGSEKPKSSSTAKKGKGK